METKEQLKQAIISHYEVYIAGYEQGKADKQLETEPCPDCDGDGGNNANCKRCRGTGIIEISESFFKK